MGLLGEPRLQLIQLHPVFRVLIVNFSGQLAFESLVIIGLDGDQTGDELPLFSRRQLDCLVFQLCE